MRIDGDLPRALRRMRPDLVGLTSYTCHVNTVKSLAATIKNILHVAATVVGGHHATVRPEDFDIPAVDFIVSGEGCTAMRDLVVRGIELRNIGGLGYLQSGRRRYNPSLSHPDLDSLPLPRRDLVKKYRKQYFFGHNNPATAVRTSLGCQNRCHFCPLWGITGGRYLKRSVESLLNEIEGIEGDFIFFIDDESMADWPRMEKLAHAIKSSGLSKRFHAYARADTIISHPGLFRRWQAAGLRSVSVGYESGDDDRLEKMNKNLTAPDQARATAVLNGLGIGIDALFIIEPDFVKEDFLAMLGYIRKLGLKWPSYSVMTPVPGTPLYERSKHLLTTNNWDHYDMAHAVLPTALEPAQFYKYCRHMTNSSGRIELRALSLLRYPLSVVTAKIGSYLRYLVRSEEGI